MKCMAMRVSGVETSEDKADIIALCGVQTAAEALDIVAAFYPRDRIPPRAQFGLEEIFQEPRRD